MTTCLYTLIRNTLHNTGFETTSIRSRGDDLFVTCSPVESSIIFEVDIISASDTQDLIVVREDSGEVLCKTFSKSTNGIRDTDDLSAKLIDVTTEAFNKNVESVNMSQDICDMLEAIRVCTILSPTKKSTDIWESVCYANNLYSGKIITAEYFHKFLDFVFVTISDSVDDFVFLTSDKEDGSFVKSFDNPCDCYAYAMSRNLDISRAPYCE